MFWTFETRWESCVLEIFLTPQWESLIYDIYIGVMTCIVLRRQFLGQTVSFGFALCSGHNDLNLLFNVHMGEKNPAPAKFPPDTWLRFSMFSKGPVEEKPKE